MCFGIDAGAHKLIIDMTVSVEKEEQTDAEIDT